MQRCFSSICPRYCRAASGFELVREARLLAACVFLGKPQYAWNLRKDDLTEQTEETIDFIAEPLK